MSVHGTLPTCRHVRNEVRLAGLSGPARDGLETTPSTRRRSGGLVDDFIRECEHRRRDVEVKSLAVASGDKDVAFRQQFQ